MSWKAALVMDLVIAFYEVGEYQVKLYICNLYMRVHHCLFRVNTGRCFSNFSVPYIRLMVDQYYLCHTILRSLCMIEKYSGLGISTALLLMYQSG